VGNQVSYRGVCLDCVFIAGSASLTVFWGGCWKVWEFTSGM
jgi:hypothetical protein